MKGKWFCICMTALLLAVLLLGCVQPTGTDTQPPAQDPTAAPTAGPTQAPTQAPTQTPTEQPTEAPTQPEAYVFDLTAGAVAMTQYDDTWTWYAEVTLAKNEALSITNKADGTVWGPVTAKSAGTYMAIIRFEEGADGKPRQSGDIVLERPEYYVVGTCGSGNWGADATASNYRYQMIQEGSAYVLNAEFTAEDTGEDGKVAFMVAYGADGVVARWYGNSTGERFVVDPGSHTITYDPAKDAVSIG